jgi:hypothetical protein
VILVRYLLGFELRVSKVAQRVVYVLNTIYEGIRDTFWVKHTESFVDLVISRTCL